MIQRHIQMKDDPQNGKGHHEVACLIYNGKILTGSMPTFLYGDCIPYSGKFSWGANFRGFR